MSQTNESIFINPVYDNNKTSKCPILLFDKSGSTNDHFADNKTILRSYSRIMQLFKNQEISIFRMILWNDKIKVVDEVLEINDISKILSCVDSGGGTYLTQALSQIPNNWLQDEIIDIYIITDGQVGDSSLTLQKYLKELFQNYPNLNIYIITFEANKNDYAKMGCNVTSVLYHVIQDGGLTNYIKQYLSYNQIFIDTPFINFSNISLMHGYIQFKDKCFHIDNLRKFIKHIDNLITCTEDVHTLNNLLFNCCSTICQIIKYKTNISKNNIIELFARIFSIRMNYTDVYNRINNQVNGIIEGKASSYNQYISNRNDLFERTDQDLKENVSKSIVVFNENYFTIPLPTKNSSLDYYDDFIIFECSNLMKFEEYKIGLNVYNQGSLRVDSYSVPILPNINITTNLATNQHIRQWIRAIYSNFYGIKPNSDELLYMFLTDMLKVIISSVGDQVKKAYRNLGLIMLDRARFNSGGVKEIKFLRDGNAPLPNSEIKQEMKEIFDKCSFRGFGKAKLEPYTLWYAIILAINDPILITNQLEYCKENITQDFPNLQDMTQLLELVKKKYNIKCTKYVIDTHVELDYTCYVTLDDTTETGGYKILSHNVSKNSPTICDPRFVMCNEALEMLKQNNNLKCPLCMKRLTEKDLAIISAKSNVIKQDKIKIEVNYNNIITWFRTDNNIVISPTHIINTITTSGYYDTIFSNSNLLPIDMLDFRVKAYDVADYMIMKSTDRQHIEIKTSVQFRSMLSKNYGFLNCMNWNNICLAGGFIRSMLFNQEVNDIDLFMYGLNEEATLNKVRYIANVLQNYFYDKYVLIANKKDTKVIELLIMDIVSTNDVYKKFVTDADKLVWEASDDEEEAESEKVIRNEEKSKEMHDKRYYFDNLKARNTNEKILSKFRVLHKIQIIIQEHIDIYDVINNFDLTSSMAAYDGNKLLFNEQGYASYKYMFSVIRKDYGYSTLSRLIKYYNYGFALAFHQHNANVANCNLCKNYEVFPKSKNSLFKYREIRGQQSNPVEGLILSNNIRLIPNLTIKSGITEEESATKVINRKGYYPCLSGNGTEKALINLLKYVEIKNSVETNNIIWDVYDLCSDNDIIIKFLEYVKAVDYDCDI